MLDLKSTAKVIARAARRMVKPAARGRVVECEAIRDEQERRFIEREIDRHGGWF